MERLRLGICKTNMAKNAGPSEIKYVVYTTARRMTSMHDCMISNAFVSNNADDHTKSASLVDFEDREHGICSTVNYARYATA